MEGQVWSRVEELLQLVEGRPKRCRYSDKEVLRVILWAVLHDRPMNWACEALHWPTTICPMSLPTPSTISRRWKRQSLQGQAEALHQQSLRRLGAIGRYAAIDGRSLVVGGCSKDPDARYGRAAGGMGKGYKMHAMVDQRHIILSYAIHPLNEAEPTVAQGLLSNAPSAVTRIVADGAYDSMRLHSVAHATGQKLYTPIRQNRVGRRQQPRRLQLLRLLQRSIGARLLKSRDEIERTFGQMSTLSFGFKGLPAWSRRTHRVYRWMWGKNLLYHAWLLNKNHSA
jgi:hypothetical protein